MEIKITPEKLLAGGSLREAEEVRADGYAALVIANVYGFNATPATI